MKPDLGISLVLLRPLAQSVLRLGGDPRAFLSALGVAPDADVDAYVPASRVVAVLDALPGNGSSVALALARALPIGTLGFLDYLFVASSNLREALSRMVRFYGLATQLVSLAVEENDGEVRLSHTLIPGAPRVVTLTELAFAAFVSRARDAVGEPFSVRAVRFTHQVRDARPFAEFFRAKVEFGAHVDELLFSASALDVPFSTSDPTTVAFLEAQAARMKANVRSADSFPDRARAAVMRRLRNKSSDVATLARDLHVSTRTLQRLLKENGTSHRELVADVRRELATQLLARADVSIVEVAFELGFTEQAAFHRAFARWTGMTPGAFRAQSKRT